MPQMIPYTLELQWNSAALLIGFTTICLACYILPMLSKLHIARTFVSQ